MRICATRAVSLSRNLSYKLASTITREHAEHFCPWNPNADAATPSTAASRLASAATTMESLPPISRIVRLIQTWPGLGCAARKLISSPTSRDPVKAMNRVLGCSTSPFPNVAPEPGQKLTTPGGSPASSSALKNLADIVGESLDGFSTTLLPHTIEATVIPHMIASGKFQGEITAPTPSGM